MKILMLSDLHHHPNNPLSNKKLKVIKGLKDKFEAVLLLGDNAEATKNFGYHHHLFKSLRERFECSIGFVVGNHDFWAKKYDLTAEQVLYEVMPKLAKEYDLTYLENENLKLSDLEIAGTYGHYDYSLSKNNEAVTLQNIENYSINLFNHPITWRDGEKIELGNITNDQLCSKLLINFQSRIINTKRPLITASHTIPSRQVSGHPDSLMQEFCLAYSGSTKLEEIIAKSKAKMHFCGHTHAISQMQINKTRIVNVSSDYEVLRYIILDENSGKLSYTRFETDFTEPQSERLETCNE
jgi:predicted phosphodiesterase